MDGTDSTTGSDIGRAAGLGSAVAGAAGALEVLEVRDREQSQLIERQAQRMAELEQENRQLRQKNPTPRLEESYSLRAEEQRREAALRGGESSKKKRQKSARRGRISTDKILALATRHEDIWPSEYAREDCPLRYSRAVWRIINGQAVLVAYHIYAEPNGRVPQIPGVPQRGEYGSEIITALAFQHYIYFARVEITRDCSRHWYDLRLRNGRGLPLFATPSKTRGLPHSRERTRGGGWESPALRR